MKRFMIILLMLLITATSFGAFVGRHAYNFSLQDEFFQDSATIISALILTTTGDVATITLTRQAATGTTNPLTGEDFIGSKTIVFYSEETSVDIVITDGVATRTFSDITPVINRGVMPSFLKGLQTPVIMATGTLSLTVDQSGAMVYNTTSGTLTVTLPDAAVGLYYTFVDPSATTAYNVLVQVSSGGSDGVGSPTTATETHFATLDGTIGMFTLTSVSDSLWLQSAGTLTTDPAGGATD